MATAFNMDSAPEKQRAISPRLRFSVLERDGFKCCYCGATPDRAELRVDHIYPVAKGGTDHLDNLITACDPCNAGKSDRIMVPELVQAMQAKARERNGVVGPKRPRAKPVTIDGITYPSISTASTVLGVKCSAIRDFEKTGIVAERKNRKRTRTKVVKGINFHSLFEAAAHFGVSYDALWRACKAGRADQFIDGVDLNKRKKRCVIDGVEYGSRTEASKSLGLSFTAIAQAVEFGTVHYPQKPSSLTKPVTIRGCEYPSKREAARSLGVCTSTITEAERLGALDRVGLRRKPGYDGIPKHVYWDGIRMMYRVAFTVNGKKMVFGRYKHLSDAAHKAMVVAAELGKPV